MQRWWWASLSTRHAKAGPEVVMLKREGAAGKVKFSGVPDFLAG